MIKGITFLCELPSRLVMQLHPDSCLSLTHMLAFIATLEDGRNSIPNKSYAFFFKISPTFIIDFVEGSTSTLSYNTWLLCEQLQEQN